MYFTRRATEMFLGVLAGQNSYKSPAIQLIGNGNEGYRFVYDGREEAVVTDPNGWFTSVINSIKWE